MTAKSIIQSALLALIMLAATIWFFGSHNVHTPAGFVGYVQVKPVFAKAEFVGLQTGPTSSGLRWCYDTWNQRMTL